MIKTHRTRRSSKVGTRVDPTIVRQPTKIKQGACLACASGSRVAQHTCQSNP